MQRKKNPEGNERKGSEKKKNNDEKRKKKLRKRIKYDTTKHGKIDFRLNYDLNSFFSVPKKPESPLKQAGLEKYFRCN